MNDPHIPFEEMAAVIKANPGKFGGAVVVVPPGENAEPVSFFLADGKSNVGFFYGTVESKIKMAIEELDQGQQGPFRNVR